MELKDELKKLRSAEQIEAWFAIEAMGVGEDVVADALQQLLARMREVKEVFIYDEHFSPIDEVKKLPANVKEGTRLWSQVLDLKIFCKDFTTLLTIIMHFGPSSVEIIGPSKKNLSLEEMQRISNLLAGMMHQFASIGIGGIVVAGKRQKEGQ